MVAESLTHKTFTGRWGSRTTNATERVADGSYLARVENLEPGEGLASISPPPVSSSSLSCQGWDRPFSSMAASRRPASSLP